jgi:hypothetical protein
MGVTRWDFFLRDRLFRYGAAELAVRPALGRPITGGSRRDSEVSMISDACLSAGLSVRRSSTACSDLHCDARRADLTSASGKGV